MKTITNQEFGGERPLYNEHGLRLQNVCIHPGESSLKEGSDIEARSCRFEGKYPLWECRDVYVKDCEFTEGARAAIWYTHNLTMEDSVIMAPKMFREAEGITLRNVRFEDAAETFWHCSNIVLENVEAIGGDYIFMRSSDIVVRGLKLQNKYCFQSSRNVEIHNAVINTKDAFWDSENVTVYDSVIIGEYLAWYSKNLRLVNCRIGETQPLCYAEGLVLENCTFEPDADLAFEYSDVLADVRGNIPSVKNPRSGKIVADSYGEIILDANIKAPGNCSIEIRNK